MVTSFIATDPAKLDDDQHSNAGLYLLYMKKLWQSFMSDNKITEVRLTGGHNYHCRSCEHA